VIRYLLDTNALSEALRPAPDPTFLEQFREHQSTCALSSITWHELAFGVARLPSGRRKDHLERFLLEAVASLPILPYDSSAAALHAGERVRHAAAGRSLPFADGQVASIAVANGLLLVTRNARDVAYVDGLQLAPWWS
jgi:tRNA(fMet)-specific endonuclease VapC